MTELKTYSAEEARVMILNRSIKGRYRVEGSLNLSGCELAGMTMPEQISGSLDLWGCNLAGVTLPEHIGDRLYLSVSVLAGVALPKHISGWLDISGCDLAGVTMPEQIGGSLHLWGCDLAGVALPKRIGGSLYLSGCDLAGVTLPERIGGWLDLSGCKNPDPAQWWTEGAGTKRHCIAISRYALIQTDQGKYIAGGRGPWTAEQALAHWGDPSRMDERAKVFVAAITEAESKPSKE